MPWPVHPTGFFGARGDNDSYKIERSLRFNSADTTYLTRTFGTPTNQNVWTLSVWLKRSAFGGSGIFGASSSGVTNYEAIYFDSSSNLLAETYINLPPIQARNQKTNALFRDPSAWYHFVVVKNGSWASSYPYTIYVNGVSQSVTTFDLNTSFVNRINSSGVTHQIGTDGLTSNLFNGYMAEFYFIDGQALTPSSFGETDAITGRWKAKAYSGTYGTNGFYLNFADNSGTTSTTLGKDSSGNGNNWTPNNFSVTAGAGNDSLLDSPTNSGTSGNYATLNPLNAAHTYSNGNLDIVTSTTSYTSIPSAVGSTGMSSGKWYFEFTPTVLGTNFVVGITSIPSTNGYVGQTAASYGYYSLNGNKITGGVDLAYGASIAINDVVGVAVDLDSGKIWWSKNGTWQASGDPAAGTNSAYSSIPSGTYFPSVSKDTSGASTISGSFNFGQRPFAYTAPTGFKALCTTNLPQPTIQKSSKYMDVVAYTGTGASNSISSLGFSPDLVWIKNRGGATSHAIYDTTRGTQAQLSSDTTGDEVTSSTGLTAFGSNGFTIGTSSLVNTSGTQYVAWTWDEAPIAGMDIVSYTGSGANRTIAHNLGVAPKMMIVKARVTASTDQGWPVYHTGVASDAETDYLLLNSAAAAADLNTVWNDTAPTSSVFSVGTNALVNTNNDTYIAYLFAEVEGFSKFGSYTGNGSSDGPFVWCGFRPRYILIKCAGTAETNWIIHDTARNDINLSGKRLMANISNAEASDNGIDILSNGFKMRSADGSTNTSTSIHIFAAFAESPFKYARAR